MQNDVTTIKVSRVIKAGDYYLMSLPTDYIRKTGLGKGDEIIVSYDNSLLMVMKGHYILLNWKSRKSVGFLD